MYTHHRRVAFLALALLLTAAFAAMAATGTAGADGSDAGTSRLLLDEVEAIRANTASVSRALADDDAHSAHGEVGGISDNWPAVRSELEQRGDAATIAEFEDALADLDAAVGDGDAEAAATANARLGAALDEALDSMATVDVDGERVLTAFVIPLLLVAAISISIVAGSQKLGVKA
jgi:hypothetical protein